MHWSFFYKNFPSRPGRGGLNFGSPCTSANKYIFCIRFFEFFLSDFSCFSFLIQIISLPYPRIARARCCIGQSDSFRQFSAFPRNIRDVLVPGGILRHTLTHTHRSKQTYSETDTHTHTYSVTDTRKHTDIDIESNLMLTLMLITTSRSVSLYRSVSFIFIYYLDSKFMIIIIMYSQNSSFVFIYLFIFVLWIFLLTRCCFYTSELPCFFVSNVPMCGRVFEESVSRFTWPSFKLPHSWFWKRSEHCGQCPLPSFPFSLSLRLVQFSYYMCSLFGNCALYTHHVESHPYLQRA